jgi:hypothetical protein
VQERLQILPSDAPVATGCSVRVQQILFDPIDDRSGIDLK